MGPIIRQSQGPSDTLNGPGKCGSGATPPTQNDRCGVGARQPLLVISPWAKQNFVDNTFTDQASIPRFIEDNWNLGRIGNESADSAAGSLMNAFDFNQKSGQAPAIILNDQTGEVTKVIQPNGQVDSPSQSPAPPGNSSPNNGAEFFSPLFELSLLLDEHPPRGRMIAAMTAVMNRKVQREPINDIIRSDRR